MGTIILQLNDGEGRVYVSTAAGMTQFKSGEQALVYILGLANKGDKIMYKMGATILQRVEVK